MNGMVIRRARRALAVAPFTSGESILVRSLRALRWTTQFGRMLGPLLRPTEASDVPDQCTVECSDEFLQSLTLPDRPQKTAFEKTLPDEASTIQRMARLAACAVVTNYCHGKSADPAAKALRDQHAIAHGCVRAEFIVRDDLTDEFAIGVFRRGARYDAVLRFSNARPTPQSDKKWDGRGLAIKLIGVNGPTALSTLVPDLAHLRDQDFLFGSFPVFFSRNIFDYAELMDAVVAPTGSRRERLVWLGKWLRFIGKHPRQFSLFVRIGMRKIDNPLHATYHSMAPYLFGEDKVVRYMVGPTDAGNEPAADPDRSRSDNFLREALAADLNPDRHYGEKVVLNFSIRLRHTAEIDDVEDASRWWNGPLDANVLLARIEIPAQDFLTPDDVCACENRAFNPWNCLWQHRPLGSLNRMRLAVYLASLQVRHKLNMLAP